MLIAQATTKGTRGVFATIMSEARWAGFFLPNHLSRVIRLSAPRRFYPSAIPPFLPPTHALFIYLLYTPRLISTFARMPLPQPPYPSFTLVMSSPQFAIYDNMRLPGHRASHQNRFHPYPRNHPSHQERHMVRPRFIQLSSRLTRYSDHRRLSFLHPTPALCSGYGTHGSTCAFGYSRDVYAVNDTRVVKSTIVIEDTQNAECRSETSTVAAESILRRKKLKTAASRLSVRDDGFPSLNRL